MSIAARVAGSYPCRKLRGPLWNSSGADPDIEEIVHRVILKRKPARKSAIGNVVRGAVLVVATGGEQRVALLAETETIPNQGFVQGIVQLAWPHAALLAV